MQNAHIRWGKGGDGRVVSAEADRIELASTIPSAPGSRLEGSLASGTPIRVKVARCRRQADAESGSESMFLIEGRLLDATRDARAEIADLAASTPET